MRKNRALSSLIVFALAALVALGASGPAAADANPSPFVGTFFSLTETGAAVETGLVITIFKDGNIHFLWGAGTTELAGNAFTHEIGVWKKTGPREITARVLNFNFLYPTNTDPAGVIVGNGIDDYVITFYGDFDTISGTFNGTVYAPDVNPANPFGETPLYTFDGDFEGERITVD
jgi:hypothetical protein